MSGYPHERMGPAGNCICPKCGTKIPHRKGNPCQDELCPSCGSKMLREGSSHHKLFQEKQRKKDADDSD